jgi:alginate O-acetyltransferase complex protein AlgJ
MPANKNNLLIIFLFIIAVTLPVFFSARGGTISTLENRYLASFPDIFSSGLRLNPGVKAGLENWLNDNVGGRELALSINRLISYKVFHVFPERDVVEGKDGWLYLIPDYDILNYTNASIPTAQHVEWLMNRFSSLTSIFQKRGIKFTIMTWPTKYSLYPENFPNTLVKVNSETAIEEYDRELTGNPNFDYRTPLKILTAGKQSQAVYSKAADRSHWNQFGAFLGYTALMQQARDHLPGLKILTEENFTITPVMKITSLPWGFTTREEDTQYDIKGGFHAVSDLSFFDTFSFSSNDPWRSYNYYKNTDSSLPKAIIVGDSYIWLFLLPDISESFSELVFIHFMDMNALDSIIEIIKPDIVIMAGLGPGVADIFATYTPSSPEFMYADILSINAPSQVKFGNKLNIDITVQNTGTQIWSETNRVRLCIFVNGQDYGYRIQIPAGLEVNPGEVYTFKLINSDVPDISYINMEFQMVQESVSFFGLKKGTLIAIKK